MKIHHWFIPSRKNKFHPIALRSTGLFVFMAIFVAIPPIYNIISIGRPQVLGYATNITVNDVFNLSNQERINNGLSALNFNPQLSSAAQAKANDMFTDNYWAHVAPDGTQPWSFIIASGYDYHSAGENLAKDFNTSGGVVNGWMGSPSHRANILNSSYQDVGYAVVNGNLLGSDTTLVVAMYGAENEPVIASTTPPPAPIDTPAPDTTATNTATETQIETVQNTDTTSIETQPTSETNEATETIPANNTDTEQKEVQATSATSTKTATKDKSNLIGSVAGAAISLPIKAYSSFNWGQKVSILLVCTLILLFIMKHTMIWREQKRGLKHIWLRAHPMGQVAILITVLIVTIFSGVGVVL